MPFPSPEQYRPDESTPMGYTVHYSGSKRERYAAGLEDVKGYLGEKYLSLTRALVADSKAGLQAGEFTARRLMKTLRFQLAFAGIQGLPAKAYARHVCYLATR